MTEVSVLIEKFICRSDNHSDSVDKELKDEIFEAVASNSIGLSDWVSRLGLFLTSTDNAHRERATHLLAESLKTSVSRDASEMALNSLSTFFRDRLSDTQCIAEVLKAVANLLEHPRIKKEDASGLIISVLNTVHTQALSQKVRFVVFSIVSIGLERFSKELEDYAEDLISGFIQAMDGEKDPRNLMLVFRIFEAIFRRSISSNPGFSPVISRLCDEIFDVTSCYFPITFKAPKDDPFGISGDDLVLSLRRCLSACPLMSVHVLPFLLDKLPSSSEKAKVDVVKTLSSCIVNYLPDKILAFSGEIADTIAKEIFMADDDELVEASLEVILALSKSCGGTQAAEIAWSMFAGDLLKTCLGELMSPESRKARLSCKILHSLVKGSAFFFDKSFSSVFENIIQQIIDSGAASSPSIKLAGFEIVSALLEGWSQGYESSMSPSIIVYVRKTAETACRELGFGYASSIEPLYSLLANSLRPLIELTKFKNDSVEDIISIYKDSITHWTTLFRSKLFTDEIQFIVKYFSIILTILPNFDSVLIHELQSYTLPELQSSFTKFNMDIASSMIEVKSLSLRSILFNLFVSKLRSNDSWPKDITIKLLRKLISTDDFDYGSFDEIHGLIFALDDMEFDSELKSDVETIIRILMISRSLEDQEIIFHQSVLSQLSKGSFSYSVLLEILCFRQEIIRKPEMLKFFENSFEDKEFALRNHFEPILFASILNKLDRSNVSNLIVDNVVAHVSKINSSESTPVRLFMMILKALLMSSKPQCNFLMDSIVDTILSSASDVAISMIEHFFLVFKDMEFLSRQTFCTSSILYKQKFVSVLLPKIEDIVSKSSGSDSSVALFALVTLLSQSDPSLVKVEDLPDLLIRSLTFTCSPSHSIATLKCILNVLNMNPVSFENQAPTLLSIVTSNFLGTDDIACLISAIKVLEALSRLSLPFVRRFAKQVITDLVPGIGHSTKLVRFSSRKCRNAWYLASTGSAN